jgi:hypothetical protein
MSDNYPPGVTDADIDEHFGDDDEEDSDELGETEDYHGDHPGDCPGTCDYCGFWWCEYADEVATCDKGCPGYALGRVEETNE